MENNELTKISLFQGKQIRRVFHENEWWFSVVDVVGFLTESQKPRDYWHKMKTREKRTSESELSTICRQLKLEAADGKKYTTDCANTEGIFRIIQSIPSPKAEPFKMWLAKVGKERIDEIENPELGMDRVKSIYEKKGYDKGWIDKRMRGISVRVELLPEEHAKISKIKLGKKLSLVKISYQTTKRNSVISRPNKIWNYPWHGTARLRKVVDISFVIFNF